MGAAWQPERVVGEDLARRLIRAQFPTVAAAAVERLAEGWDATLFRVDGDWVFRFPRRATVVRALPRELAALPVLAPLLPVAVPEPVHVGRPSRAFPWPFYGARWIEGVEATFTEEREPLAAPLGRTLRALHDASVPDLPVDVNGRADMSRRVPLTRAELAAAAAEGLWEAPPSVAALLAQAEALPPPERLVVCHGDLHVRQVIVDGARLAGFVDWIDVCRSDPGIDLQLVFAFLPPAARPAFFAAYGPVDEASLLRARVLALFLSAVLARYARDVGNAALEREAVSSLDRAAHP